MSHGLKVECSLDPAILEYIRGNSDVEIGFEIPVAADVTSSFFPATTTLVPRSYLECDRNHLKVRQEGWTFVPPLPYSQEILQNFQELPGFRK
jgi:hypothetical protein